MGDTVAVAVRLGVRKGVVVRLESGLADMLRDGLGGTAEGLAMLLGEAHSDSVDVGVGVIQHVDTGMGEKRGV